jgi:HSP20 family protein
LNRAAAAATLIWIKPANPGLGKARSMIQVNACTAASLHPRSCRDDPSIFKEGCIMSLVQWNPFREMDELLSRLQRSGGLAKAHASDEAWMPVVDISETPKDYVVRAELPGVGKDDVKVNVENGVLTLSGERKSVHQDKDERFHRIERSYGIYSRSFSLPDDVLEDKITADSNEGVLTIHLPKTDIKKTAAKQIKVQ